MIDLALALALTATTAQGAAVPLPPKPAVVQPRAITDADRQVALQRMGFSAAAIPLLLKEMADERADTAAALPPVRTQSAAIAAGVNANPFDAAGFERLVRARQTALDTLATTVLGRRMALLRSLPPADQQLYARGLVMPRGRPAAAPSAVPIRPSGAPAAAPGAPGPARP